MPRPCRHRVVTPVHVTPRFGYPPTLKAELTWRADRLSILRPWNAAVDQRDAAISLRRSNQARQNYTMKLYASFLALIPLVAAVQDDTLMRRLKGSKMCDPSLSGNGICDIENKDCSYDGGDCLIFQKSAYQEDLLEKYPELMAYNHGDYHGLKLADGKEVINCNRLTQCEWPGKQDSWLGDGTCDEDTGCYSFKICNYDDGDCNTDQLESPPDDCSRLTTCDWPGIDIGKLGDGSCDANSCYNSKACGWDGGDCCGWSCRKNQAGGITFPDNNYCGMNGYDCKTQDNCFSKDIKVYRFQITGEVNDAGNEEEIQVFVNSGLFWPKAANQCADNRDGDYCGIRGSTTRELENAGTVTVTNWYESLSFGIRELDAAVSADDFYAVTLAKDEWFSSTCSCYGIQASINYEEEKERNVCWSAGASNTQGGEISGPVKGAEASISNEFNINAGVESCTSWTEPAKAYVWYASVCPTNPFGDHNP